MCIERKWHQETGVCAIVGGGGAGRCFVYIKFFGAEREEKTGGRSESGAHATDGLDEDCESEDENIQAEGGTKASESDDEDFQPNRRNRRPKTTTEVTNASGKTGAAMK